jgi:NAD(P)H-dependent flavin oxidoreductase YrpB (nitropropane dioxygenase family)
MAAAFVLGAEAVQMGTRLLASADSPVHGNLKQAVVDTDETGTVMLPLHRTRMMRVIRTPAAERLDTATSAEAGAAALQRVQRLYFEGDWTPASPTPARWPGASRTCRRPPTSSRRCGEAAARCWLPRRSAWASPSSSGLARGGRRDQPAAASAAS